jgi:hypothetical protein
VALRETESIGVAIEPKTRADLERLADRTGIAFPACIPARR